MSEPLELTNWRTATDSRLTKDEINIATLEVKINAVLWLLGVLIVGVTSLVIHAFL